MEDRALKKAAVANVHSTGLIEEINVGAAHMLSSIISQVAHCLCTSSSLMSPIARNLLSEMTQDVIRAMLTEVLPSIAPHSVHYLTGIPVPHMVFRFPLSLLPKEAHVKVSQKPPEYQLPAGLLMHGHCNLLAAAGFPSPIHLTARRTLPDYTGGPRSAFEESPGPQYKVH